MDSNIALAHLALEQYGLKATDLTLSQDMWNTTYCVTTSGGQKYNLRLCGAALQDSQLITDEMVFIDFIAQRNELRVPKPIRNLNGDFVTRMSQSNLPPQDEGPQSRLCCLFEWIEGEVVRDRLTDSVLHKMGSATALLHRAAGDFRFPSPDDPFRTGYDYDEAVVLQHREWLTELRSEISHERVALIEKAIDHLLDQFKHLPKNRDTYGFIHADLNPNNFIVTNAGLDDEEVSVIDFEQLGRGHFCVDLATTMDDLDERKTDFEMRWSSFKKGYQTVAGLPFADEQELAPFVMLVRLNFLDWIYNTPNPHVRQKYEARFQEVHELIRNGLHSNGYS